MVINRMLQGRHVLIAHERSCQRLYLAGAVHAAGATVAGPVGAGADGIALLNCGLRVHCMVISHALPHRDAVALIDAATSENVRTVIVHPAQVDVSHPFSDYRCLAAPYTVFQVVTALADVLAITRGCVHWSIEGH